MTQNNPRFGKRIGINESEWRDSAEALADWECWLATLEPLEFTLEDEAAMVRFEATQAQYNIEAMRSEMSSSRRDERE
jgi:hypothetical protein